MAGPQLLFLAFAALATCVLGKGSHPVSITRRSLRGSPPMVLDGPLSSLPSYARTFPFHFLESASTTNGSTLADEDEAPSLRNASATQGVDTVTFDSITWTSENRAVRVNGQPFRIKGINW
jgi:hypothetical protein